MSSRCASRSRRRLPAGVVDMRVPFSPARRATGAASRSMSVVDVGEVVDAGHGLFDGGRAAAAGDPVGQRVELGDQFVVGDRVGRVRRAVGRRGRDARSPSSVVTAMSVREALGDGGRRSSALVEVDVGAFDRRQMSSASRRAGVNCSGSTLPSSSAAAVVYPRCICAPIGVSGRSAAHQPCL